MRTRVIGLVTFFAAAASAGPTATTTAQPVAVQHPSLLVKPQLRKGMSLKDVFAAANPMPSVPPPPLPSSGSLSISRSCSGGGTMQVTVQGTGTQSVDLSTGTGSYHVSGTFVRCVGGGTTVDGTILLGYQGTGSSVTTATSLNASAHWVFSYDGSLTITRVTNGTSNPVSATFRALTIAVDYTESAVLSGALTTSESWTMRTVYDGSLTMNGQTSTFNHQVMENTTGAF